MLRGKSSLILSDVGESKDGRAKPAPLSAGNPGSRLYAGVLALGLLSCSLILGLVVWQSLRERAERIEREKDALSRMAEVVATETGDLFGRIRFFFETADLWLAANPGADPRFDAKFIELVETFRASMQTKVDIRLVSEAGGLFFIPSKSREPLVDVGDRDYYLAQRSPSTRGFYVGNPMKGRVTHVWTLPVSHPLAIRGSGISTIWAAIELPVLEKLYDAIRPKPNGSVSLIRRDGLYLARAPFDESVIGTSISSNPAAWQRTIAQDPKGIWIRKTTSTDSQERIVAYSSLASSGLIVSVSSSLSDVLAAWKSDLWWRGAIAALMTFVLAYAFSRLLMALSSLDTAQAELRSNMERLGKSDATKDKLFSVIAHDLRGPIGGMTSLLENLSADKVDMSAAELGEFIDALRTASRNTSQLLENLLAWSRSQRGEMPFRPESILVLPIVEECVEVFGLNAAEKGIAVETSVEKGLEARADPEQLKTLLRNLISNAVKFSSRGARVRIAAGKAEDGTLLEVRDEGMGMDSAQLGALFEFGAMRSRAGTANERGSGLGLLLCKEIVDLHGGRIEAASEPGKGSSFSVFLPD